MNLYYAQKTDVDLDGLVEEWIIIIDDGIYVVYPDVSGYKTRQLEYFWGADPKQYSGIDFKIERWKGIANPVLTAVTADELLMFGIGKDFSSTSLVGEFAVKNVSFSPNSEPAQFQVFYKKLQPDRNFYGGLWSGYRWDSNDQAFKEDLLEYLLFVEQNPDQAVDLVKTIFPILNKWKSLDSAHYWLPRYFYLCGLTYELSGDKQKAAEIYWQLWHDFPESHFARLAEFKLELVNP
jgi:tetratricopeptide (TPR) repeat protein